MVKRLVVGLAVMLTLIGLVGLAPVHAQESSPAAFQLFEGGYMIWRAETGEIWVLTFVDWQSRFFPQSAYEDLLDNPVTDEPPAGLIKPVSGFGRVWGNNPEIQQVLGWALMEEVSYTATLEWGPPSGSGIPQTLINIPDGRQLLLRIDASWGYDDGLPRSIWSLNRPAELLSTVQLFEHGVMIWWAETGSIWVLNADTQQATHYNSLDYGALPDNPVTQAPPAGLVKPIMGFGKVWGHFPEVRQALGWATGPSRSYRLSFTRYPGDTFACELSDPDLGILTIEGNTWQGIMRGL